MRNKLFILFICGVTLSLHAFANKWYIGFDNQIIRLHGNGYHSSLVYTNITPPFNELGNFNVTGSDIGAALGVLGGYAIQNSTGGWFPETRFNLQVAHSFFAPRINGAWNYTLYSPANTYSYRYDVETSLLGLDVATDVYEWAHVSPFIGIGFGVDWLKSEHFQTAPKDNADIVSFRFVGATKRNIYYQAELGLRYKADKYAIGLSYIYRYLGKADSGQGETDTGSIAPAIEDKVSESILQLQISYYF